MGIRGAWSVISKDPSRFGHRWVLQKCENKKDDQITIVLDGPSLLYHVANSYSTDKLGSEVLSPSSIYTGTVEFVQALIEVSGSKGELHVVMDGLSPKEKVPAQIQRMANQALECDVIANSSARPKVSRCEMLPLLAEAAMIEGLEAIMKSAGNVHLHRPLHGEAETYIARWLDDANQQSEKNFIFSDDTDFLVYPSCPGFIPFRSLKFTTIGVDKCLTGYLYLRSKFMAAFFPIEEEENGDIMPVVAALAGCDYRLSSEKENLLQNARSFIVQSDIGGLRQRLRNAPSGIATITAILRFVAHYYVKSKQKARANSQDTVCTTWLFSLAHALHCEGQRREERRDHFIEALEDIRQIYFSTECQRGECPSRSMMWNDLVRLVEWGVLYCRPVIETWDSNAFCKQTHERRSKRSKKKSKRSKRSLNKIIQQGETVSNESNTGLDAQDGVSTWTTSASIWTLPHFCSIRKRVYRVLQELITKKSVLASNTSCSSSSSISEYMRYGNRHNVEFKEKVVPLTSDSTNVTTSTLSSINDILLWSVFDDNVLELDEKDWLLRQDRLLLLASLMLPAREALLLLILGTAPHKVTLSRRPEPDCSSIVEVLSLINVACFHATLVMNASLYIMSPAILEGFDSKEYGIRINEVFRYDIAEAIWQGIPEVDSSLMNRGEQANSANKALDAVFGRIVDIHGVHCDTQADLECWKNKAYHLWVEKWSQVQDKIVKYE